MKPHIPFGMAVFLALGVAACSSAPIHYYTLQEPTPVGAMRPQAGVPFVIDVLPVGIPAQLDQSSLIVRQGNNSLAVLQGERWASPYADELRNALSLDVSRQLGTLDVNGLATPSGTSVLRIKVQIRSVDSWLGQRVSLEADWSLRFACDAGRGALTCHSEFSAPASGGYPELVGVQQHVIDMLAARIASDARRFSQSRQPACMAPLPEQ